MGRDNGGHPADNKHEQKLQAVLLADSFTSTFRPITFDKLTPKVLCPLNNVTILDYSIEFLAGAGVEELYVVCATSGDSIESHLHSKEEQSGIKIRIIKDSSISNAGDALRELDKRNWIQSDPFVLISGDVVTNVDLNPVLREHKDRRKVDSSAIMTVLMKDVGGWNVLHNNNNSNKASGSSLRPINQDLIVALNQTTSDRNNRILLYNSNPTSTSASFPTSFFQSNGCIQVRGDLIDAGIYVCSPDVLARFSDEFDFLHISKFISNAVAEEEEGLQSKIYASLLKSNEYAARMHDPRTYHTVSRDLLRRWCYPVVPDNLPSGCEKIYSYEMRRHLMYLEGKKGGTKIGRSTILKGPGMVGSECSIGEDCCVVGTVIGNSCNIADKVKIKDSHLWEGITVEANAIITESILCNECVIKQGAVVPRGCIIGRGCVISENVTLPEFTRITLCKDCDEEEESSSFNDFAGDSFVTHKDGEQDQPFSEKHNMSEDKNRIDRLKHEDTAVTVAIDQEIVGKNGLGQVWTPPNEDDNYGGWEDFEDDDNSSDADNDDNSNRKDISKRALERMKSQSIGYDATALFMQRMTFQEDKDEGDDNFSDEEQVGDSGDEDGGFREFGLYEEGSLITGRQAGINVVKELKLICLDHNMSNPIENLRIELNSFKFSQNATFCDCVTGVMLAILERMNITSNISVAKLVASFKSELAYWGELLRKLSHSVVTEKSLVMALEAAAIGDGVIGEVISREPSSRLLLQILYEEDIVSEEAIISWAAIRRDGNLESPQSKLFFQKTMQEFLKLLEESSSDDDSEDESSIDDASESE